MAWMTVLPGVGLVYLRRRFGGHRGSSVLVRMSRTSRARRPKLGARMDAAKHDVLAHMAFPEQHRVKPHSTNPLEWLNKEVKRRADMVGILANKDTITRLIGAVLLKQNDEHQFQNRHARIRGMTALDTPRIEKAPAPQITPKAARSMQPGTTPEITPRQHTTGARGAGDRMGAT